MQEKKDKDLGITCSLLLSNREHNTIITSGLGYTITYLPRNLLLRCTHSVQLESGRLSTIIKPKK